MQGARYSAPRSRHRQINTTGKQAGQAMSWGLASSGVIARAWDHHGQGGNLRTCSVAAAPVSALPALGFRHLPIALPIV